MAHHPLGPSGRSRWSRCPGAPAAEAHYPNEDSPASLEGTHAHEVAEALLNGTVPVDCTDEMFGYVEAYVDYVRSLMGPTDTLLVEQTIDLGEWVPGCFGTADAVILAGDTVHVVDLKYGKGVAVEVDENEQLEMYALGAAHEYAWMGPETIVCHIVQPRLGVFERWSFPASELEERGERLREQAARALDPTAPRIPGEKQCRFCRHRRHCVELAEHNLAIVTGHLTPIEEAIATPLEVRRAETISDEDLPALMPKLDLIESWCTSIRMRAYGVAAARGLLGYKFVAGRSARKWDNEKAVLEELTEAGIDLSELLETRLASPAQAEKILGKKSPLLLAHTVKAPGKPTLVPESDKRPALEQTAALVFEPIVNED